MPSADSSRTARVATPATARCAARASSRSRTGARPSRCGPIPADAEQLVGAGVDDEQVEAARRAPRPSAPGRSTPARRLGAVGRRAPASSAGSPGPGRRRRSPVDVGVGPEPQPDRRRRRCRSTGNSMRARRQARRLRRRCALGDEVGDLAHDPVQVEVLRRVDARRRRPRRGGAASAGGMIPPTITGASTPGSRSSSTDAGTSSRCEPERIERPITSTSSWTAEAAICSGVRRMPW